MSIAITTTLSSNAYHFLDTYSKKFKTPKNALIEEGLELLKNKKLEEDVARGFASRKDEYKNIASDFSPLQSFSLHE